MHLKSKKKSGCTKKHVKGGSSGTYSKKNQSSSTACNCHRSKHHRCACTCEQDFYIPFPYLPNCCDGSMGRFAGPVGNVEKAGCNCAHINYYKK